MTGASSPAPSAGHLLMRERLTALRAMWVAECAGKRGGTVAERAAASKTREQLVAAILTARERRG